MLNYTEIKLYPIYTLLINRSLQCDVIRGFLMFSLGVRIV